MLKKLEIKILFFLLFVLAISAGLLVSQDYVKSNPQTNSEIFSVLEIEKTKIKIETAQTGTQRIQGLSGREKLDLQSGLLFVFEKPDFHGFWMKEMNFPIDIIWFDKDFVVVDIKKSVSPETYPEIFKPQKPAIFVLETNAGFSDIYNIKIGSKGKFFDN